MAEDDRPTQAFGDPDATRQIGPDDRTRRLDSPGEGTAQAGADDRTRVFGPNDEPDTARIPPYREGVDDGSEGPGAGGFREVRDHYYDPAYAHRQDEQAPPAQQPPVGPPPHRPGPSADEPDRRQGRKRSMGWILLALGIILGLVVFGIVSALRPTDRGPLPVPTVTVTATATATATPAFQIPTSLPTGLPSIDLPSIDLPTSLPSIDLPSGLPTSLPTSLPSIDLPGFPFGTNN